MNTAIERNINTDSNEIIENSTRELSRKFAGIYDETYIRPIVVESYASFASAKVQSFVAVFTTRFANDRLKALAKIDGKIRSTMPSVLFVCVFWRVVSTVRRYASAGSRLALQGTVS